MAKSALTIAIRYGERRRQFESTEGQETLLMDYLTHQRRLLPLLAKTYALHSSIRRLRNNYVASLEAENIGELRRRTEPSRMARDLSENARRRGV